MKLIDILNESAEQQNINKVKTEFSRRFDKYVAQYTPQLKQASKVIDVFPIANQVKIHVLNKIVDEYPNIVSGKGGDKFAYSVWLYLSGLLNAEIQKLGLVKKLAIKTVVGDRNKFIENSKKVDDDQMYQFISDILDIGYIAGAELLSNETIGYNAATYSQQYTRWISKNWGKMESSVVNLIANKLY
jgi:hypothetical protein